MDYGSCGRPHRANRSISSQADAIWRHLIDGGNSYFKDDVRRAAMLKDKGIHYVDVGTSGGVWGLDRGYCMMIGGPDEAVQQLDPIFKTLAPGIGDITRTPGCDKMQEHRRAGLHPLRTIRCGPLREDGSQRNRIRNHASLRGGFRHLPQCQQRRSARKTFATT